MNENNFKPFDKVLVRDSEETPWSCSFYSHYEPKYEVHMCVNVRDFKYCIPYEGNEALLGTTDSPQPKRWRAEYGGTYWFVATNATVTGESCDSYDGWDNQRYESGNYFRTKKEAQAMADRFKAMLEGE